MADWTSSQRYYSTRDSHEDESGYLSFEEVVLQGLAKDGGLFIPQSIPSLPADWFAKWKNLSFADLAFEVMSLYISRSEINASELKDIVQKSYSVFRAPEVTPLIPLSAAQNLYLLELFHGPTFAFKDVALQFLGNLFEFFLVRRNSKLGAQEERHHLTVIGATSGDTGSAAIYGLRGKKDVSVFIMFPKGRVSPVQEAQMTTVPDSNVHCVTVDGTFDDCQDIVKALFADDEIKKTQHLAAVNSINWARILAQITYYFYSYFSLLKNESTSPSKVRFVVPSGNFGDILAGFFAQRMGLPVANLLIATNENDILHRFFTSGSYTKQTHSEPKINKGLPADGSLATPDAVISTLSPAMDILVSSNFERLLWILSYESALSNSSSTHDARAHAGKQINSWFASLKSAGSFAVPTSLLEGGKRNFSSERVSDPETLETIKHVYHNTPEHYVLDPHSAVGVAASLRSIKSHPNDAHISLSTAHPAKFSSAVELALKEEQGFSFEKILPQEFVGLEKKERRFVAVEKKLGLWGIRKVILDGVKGESER
ncbi:MAG: threonine synthase [Cirrosporium novae-zelandiae]|nr:MAG: threonine synthase [Cirrosporium novae-zelandiae]